VDCLLPIVPEVVPGLKSMPIAGSRPSESQTFEPVTAGGPPAATPAPLQSCPSRVLAVWRRFAAAS
jgi:hypothetical protein